MIKITQQIDFEFKDGKSSDLQELNRILASVKLEKLELKNSKGYRSVTRDGNGRVLEKYYGLESGTLNCTVSEDGDIYQIETALIDRSINHEAFLEIWRAYHPGRVHRTVMTLEFESERAYIILHHQKT